MKTKIIISLFLSLLLLVSIIPTIEVSASGYTLAQLQAKFPNGKYWNHQVKSGHGYNGIAHYGSNCGDIENSVTSTPCSTHYGTAGIGGYDCNTYKNLGMQCNGFARKLANLVYGVNDCVSSWANTTNKSTAISQVKPGDVIHYKGYDADPTHGHWVFVTAVPGSTVTLGECNYGGNCLIKWGRTLNLNNVPSLTLYKAPHSMTNNHTHKYNNKTHICDCGEFDPSSITSTAVNQTMEITKTAIDHTGPYGDCKIVNEYAKGTTVIVTAKVVNAFGSVWYKLSTGYYIYSDYVKKITTSYTSVTPSTYYIKNVATGTYLSVSEGKDVNMNAVNLWTSTGDAMKMVVMNASTGYKIRPYVCQSRLINPNAVSVAHGNNVNIYNDVNDSSQWWKFEKVGNYYVIHNVQNPSCVLDAPNGKTSVVYVRNYTGANTQKWILECVSHSYDSGKVTSSATCLTTGTKTFTCKVCGATKTETISKIGHKFDNGKVTSAANCSSDGILTYTCTVCGVLKNETISKTNHNYISTVIAPTCVNKGYTLHKCSTCSNEYTSDEQRPLDHNYVETKKEKTCTEDGYIQITCSRCGEYHITVFNKTGHSWDNGTATKSPTTAEDGIYTYTCIKCGATKDDKIPKLTTNKGDVNQDGKITASDARLTLRAAAGLETLSAEKKSIADIDTNGKITASDARKILRIAAGLDEAESNTTTVDLSKYCGSYYDGNTENGPCYVFNLIIVDKNTNVATFEIYYVGPNLSPLYETETMTTRLDSNGSARFSWTDSWGNEGIGTFTVRLEVSCWIDLEMTVTKEAETNRATLATDGIKHLYPASV